MKDNGKAEDEKHGTNEDVPKMKKLVRRLADINKTMQELRWEAKEIADGAWESCGLRAKEARQLAKELAWDETKRLEHAAFLDRMQGFRVHLGVLAGTPLGQAAEEREAEAIRSQPKSRKTGNARPKNKQGVVSHTRDRDAAAQ